MSTSQRYNLYSLAQGICTNFENEHPLGVANSALSLPDKHIASVKQSMLAIYDLQHHFLVELSKNEVFAKIANIEEEEYDDVAS